MRGIVLDLFAGPGGWSEGLRMLGMSDIGIEWDAAACATRAAAGHRTIRADVAQYPTAPFVGKVSGLIASPPCQDFSQAGKRAGRSGEKGQLIDDVPRWVDDLRPEWVACEQVPPALEVWEEFSHLFRSWGYSAWCGILNAADFGVPQTRKRAILLASRVSVAHPPTPTHDKTPVASLFGPELLPWVSMAQALGWGMTGRPYFTIPTAGGKRGGPDEQVGGSGARRSLYTERDSGRWLNTGRDWKPGGSRAEAQTIAPDRAAPTISGQCDAWWWTRPATTVCGDPRLGEPGHHDPKVSASQYGPDPIRLSVAEALTLQSFDPDYPVQGSRSLQFQQVGNAVPPLLAAHVVASLTGVTLEVAA